MKFLFNEDIFYWNMTGILGKDANWFLGFSRKIPEKDTTFSDQIKKCRESTANLQKTIEEYEKHIEQTN